MDRRHETATRVLADYFLDVLSPTGDRKFFNFQAWKLESEHVIIENCVPVKGDTKPRHANPPAAHWRATVRGTPRRL